MSAHFDSTAHIGFSQADTGAWRPARSALWGVFNGTSWVAERPLGWVAGSAVRLFVLAFVASIAVTFVNTLPATLTLDAGGALNVLLFGLTVLALAWFAPMLASEVVQGQPHLSGADAVRTGVAAGFTTVGAAMVAGAAARPVVGLAGRALARMTGGGRGGGGRGGGGRSGGARPAINYAAMQPPAKPAGGRS